jgi:hypothetical protein
LCVAGRPSFPAIVLWHPERVRKCCRTPTNAIHGLAPFATRQQNKNNKNSDRRTNMIAKFCSCYACKAGRKCPTSKATTQKTLRSFRRQSKAALQKGTEPPVAISIPYTD